MIKYFCILTILCGLFSSCTTQPPYDGPGPFDKAVDSGAGVRSSLSTAHENGKHVLLVFGANWCSDSIRMVNLLQSDPQISGVLRESYIVVRIDVGPKGSGRNDALVEEYHATIQEGIPVLVALNSSGKLLNDTREERLRDSDHKHPEKVLGFLRRYAPR